MVSHIACKKCGALVPPFFEVCNYCGSLLTEIYRLPSPNYAEVKVLSALAKTAALGAKRALETGGEVSYPIYAHEYNRLAVQTVRQFGRDPLAPLDVIRLGDAVNLNNTLIPQWRMWLETASLQLNKLVVYLESKLEQQDKQINESLERLMVHINGNLRPSFHEDPQNEIQVQDALETILRAGNFDFLREKVSIPYSAKVYKPDFTSESLDLALEVKFCNHSQKMKDIIGEMNDDIVAYQTKFTNAMFVVYDMGIIRDVKAFTASFEIPNVYVLVVKR
jgi:hypothetical protein